MVRVGDWLGVRIRAGVKARVRVRSGLMLGLRLDLEFISLYCCQKSFFAEDLMFFFVEFLKVHTVTTGHHFP